MKKTRLQRLVRAYFRLPAWSRPALVGAALVLVAMSIKICRAVPEILAGRESFSGLAQAVGAAGGAGFLGGLIHGLTRDLQDVSAFGRGHAGCCPRSVHERHLAEVLAHP